MSPSAVNNSPRDVRINLLIMLSEIFKCADGSAQNAQSLPGSSRGFNQCMLLISDAIDNGLHHIDLAFVRI